MQERSASSVQQGLALALASAAAFGTNIVSAQLASQAGLSGPLIVFYRVFLMLAANPPPKGDLGDHIQQPQQGI